MRVVIPSPKKLLLDADAALYVGGRGHEAEKLKQKWSRYPWATHILVMTDKAEAVQVATMVKDYAAFVDAT